MEFQEQLYRLRKQAGLSQEELSHIIGVSRQAVQKWEAGSARPDLDNLIALASHFKLSLDQLVGLTENHSSPISFAQNGYYSPSKTSNSIYFIPCRWHYEYKSKCTLWGVPVLHIHFADRGLARATGIFAIGNSSFGLVSLGGISVGLFSLGGLSLGVLSFGGIALGAMAWGGCAIGVLAAFGGLAVGNVAMGGCAVGDVAIGSKAVGDTAFSLGEGIHATAQVWNEFCHAVQARGFGYQLLSYILSHVKLF